MLESDKDKMVDDKKTNKTSKRKQNDTALK